MKKNIQYLLFIRRYLVPVRRVLKNDRHYVGAIGALVSAYIIGFVCALLGMGLLIVFLDSHEGVINGYEGYNPSFKKQDILPSLYGFIALLLFGVVWFVVVWVVRVFACKPLILDEIMLFTADKVVFKKIEIVLGRCGRFKILKLKRFPIGVDPQIEKQIKNLQ